MRFLKRLKISNDNLKTRSRYFRATEDEPHPERYWPLIPIAQQLIEKYCREYYKHFPDTFDYVFLEYQLCEFLSWKEVTPFHRTLKIDQIAIALRQPKLRLFDDKDLPF